MKKVFDCISLLNLIKDFAGLLSEYPLFYVTKIPPRTWGFLWWKDDIEKTWVIPSKRHSHPALNTFSHCEGSNKLKKICEYDEKFFALPYREKTCFNNSCENKRFVPISVVDAFLDRSVQVFDSLIYSGDFNVTLAIWYSENLLLLQNQIEDLKTVFLPHPNNLKNLTKQEMQWINPRFLNNPATFGFNIIFMNYII